MKYDSEPKSNQIETLAADGQIDIRSRGPDRFVHRAIFPSARLSPEGCSVLGKLSSLRELDLAGEHFPTTAIGPEELAVLSRGDELSTLYLHGAYLDGSRLRDAIRSLDNLSTLGLQGTRIGEHDLSILLTSLRTIQIMRLGAASGEGHHFTPEPLGIATLASLDSLPFLTSASLRELRGTDDDFAHCKFASRVKEIDLGGTSAGDKTAETLARNSGLQRVALDHSTLSDEGLKLLASVPGLRALNIAHTNVSDEGILSLTSAHALQDLNLAGVRLASSTIARLAVLSSLERLDLSNIAEIATNIEGIVQGLQGLQELFLDSPVQSPQVSALSHLPLLNHVSLVLHTSDVESWNALSKLTASIDLSAAAPPGAADLPPRITRYSLQGQPDPQSLSRVAAHSHLAKLWMSAGGNLVSGVGRNAFDNLRELLCEDAGLEDAGIVRLAACPRLEALYISSNPITSQGIAALKGSPWIHTLELRYTDINDSAIDTLVTLPHLHCLDLPGTGVTDRGAAKLAAAPNLQSLALDGNQVSEFSSNALASAPYLIEVYLYGPEVTPETIRLLTRLPELSELNLFGVALPVEAAEAIAACQRLRIVRMDGKFPAELITNLRRNRPDLVINRYGWNIVGGRARSASF
jgi:Leucine-rich repeat (LRR) protein